MCFDHKSLSTIGRLYSFEYLILIPKGTRLVLCDTLPDIHSDNTSSLLSILEKFKGARNHESRPEGKQEARDYIIETFKKYGLHVWTERAKIGGVSVAVC